MKFSSVILLALGLSANIFLHKVEARLKTEGFRNGYVGEFKYQVAINTENGQICGGGIIGDKFILTAAHCVIDEKGKFEDEQFYVIAGVTEITTNKNVGVRAEVEKVYIPKEYVGPERDEQTPDYPPGDIAVLRLKTGLGVGSRADISQLELPIVADSLYPTYLNKKAIVAGFGFNQVEVRVKNNNKLDIKKSFSNGQRKLRYGKTQVVPNSVCGKHYHIRMNDKQICATMILRDEDTVEGICDGDSGSPLVRHGTTVIGVVDSSHEECNEKKGSAIYTRVSSYVDFIENAMKDVKAADMRAAVYVKRKILGGLTSIRVLKEI